MPANVFDFTWLIKYKEVVVALIAVCGVVLPYWFQKNKELNLRIAARKRRAYTEFVENFTNTAVDVMHDEYDSKGADRARMLARNHLLLFGSDDVVRAYDTWIRYAEKEDHDVNKESELISLIFLAIRKDLLGRSKVTKEHLENLSPFSRG